MIKKNFLFAAFLILTLSLGMVPFSSYADPQDSNDKGKPNVISALGKVPGKDLYVDVLIELPEGSDPQDVVEKALARQGAVPVRSQDYSFTGLVWNQFLDNNLENDFMIQNYNPANEPSGVDGRTVLQNTHNTWNNVATSSFVFSLNPADTNRCPSLVLECYLGQPFDGNNDVGWLLLEGDGTLGVAWYGTQTDEVDIALNIDFNWYTDGTVYYDVETVLLHENGHGVGLSHSNVPGSIMKPYYGGIQRTLGSDDIDGISSLYPIITPADPPAPVDPAITITSPTTDTVNGRITIAASVVGVQNPVVHFMITGPNNETILDETDSTAPFETSTHTKDWASGQYTIEASVDSQGISDSKDVLKEGKTSTDSGGGSNCNGKSNKPECRNP